MFRKLFLLLALGLSHEALAKSPIPVTRLISVKSGKAVSAAGLSGKMVVLDFWATWCESCRENLVKLEPLFREQSHTVQMLSVNVDENGLSAPREFFALDEMRGKLNSVRENTVWDKDQKLSEAYTIDGIPYLIVVDAKGKKVWDHTGALTARDLKKLRYLLARGG